MLRVATWDPLDVDTPEWITPAIQKIRGNRRRFNWYEGDYEGYTADLIQEIRTVYREGQPVTLILQGWLNMRAVGDQGPEGIDPFGLFTHAEDRLESGLPGIWPEAGVQFWSRATEHLLRELRTAGIDIEFFALDTEVWPHRANPPYAFPGIFQEIANDPRWRTRPLVGFGGLTGSDILSHSLDDEILLNWLIFRIGEHSFAVIKNEVFTSRVLSYYPNALVSDYGDFAQWMSPDDEPTPVRQRTVGMIADALNQRPWFRAGVGNVASPTYYGQGRYHEDGRSRLDVMLEHATGLVDLYGADRVAPWITTRTRLDHTLADEEITEERYREWIRALVDLGIRRFIWWPGGGHDPVDEQLLTISAFRDAMGDKEFNEPMVDP